MDILIYGNHGFGGGYDVLSRTGGITPEEEQQIHACGISMGAEQVGNGIPFSTRGLRLSSGRYLFEVIRYLSAVDTGDRAANGILCLILEAQEAQQLLCLDLYQFSEWLSRALQEGCDAGTAAAAVTETLRHGAPALSHQLPEGYGAACKAALTGAMLDEGYPKDVVYIATNQNPYALLGWLMEQLPPSLRSAVRFHVNIQRGQDMNGVGLCIGSVAVDQAIAREGYAGAASSDKSICRDGHFSAKGKAAGLLPQVEQALAAPERAWSWCRRTDFHGSDWASFRAILGWDWSSLAGALKAWSQRPDGRLVELFDQFGVEEQQEVWRKQRKKLRKLDPAAHGLLMERFAPIDTQNGQGDKRPRPWGRLLVAVLFCVLTLGCWTQAFRASRQPVPTIQVSQQTEELQGTEEAQAVIVVPASAGTVLGCLVLGGVSEAAALWLVFTGRQRRN